MAASEPTPVSVEGPLTPSSEPDVRGQVLNGYRVGQLVAEGGTSWVFEAVQPDIGRKAAVKVLKGDIAHDEEWRARFLREAQVVASVTNRNVAEIWNYGTLADGRQYLMMPLLTGEALDEHLRRVGHLSVESTLSIVEQVLGGLAEVHQKGIVHRDVKPGNVFLVREHDGELIARVMDFGIATGRVVKLETANGDLQQSTIAGTPTYVAPEQAMGLAVSARSDLYSLGVMMFEMLAGVTPFITYPGQPLPELLRMHTSQPPPDLAKLVKVPVGVAALVRELLEKDPARRPPSAEAVRTRVRQLRQGALAPTAAAASGVLEVGPESYRPTEKELASSPAQAAADTPSRAVAVAAAVALLVGVVGLAVAISRRDTVPRDSVVVPPPAPNPALAKTEPMKPVLPSPEVATPVPVGSVAPPVARQAPSVPPPPMSPPLPTAAKPKATFKPKRGSVIEITAVAACADLERWRVDEKDRADDIATRVRELLGAQQLPSDEVARRLETLRAVRAGIASAKTADQCLAASRALTTWAERNGL